MPMKPEDLSSVGSGMLHQTLRLALWMDRNVGIDGESCCSLRSEGINIYRVSREECARLRDSVSYVERHRYNPRHLYPNLNGYGDNGERKVWSSCGSTYCTCFACCYPYTGHVRPSVSQPSQAHSAFIINRCHSYSEL